MSTMELDEMVAAIEPSTTDGAAAPGGTAAEGDALAPRAAAASPEADGIRTFRGKTLEELLPKIRAELGPEAIVVRQRDGLMGGIGGFFQQQFVEVEARAGHARIDVYDEPPETAEVGFAALLAAAEADAEPTVEALASAIEPTPAPAAEQPAPQPAAQRPVPALDQLAESVREAALAAPPAPTHAPVQASAALSAAPTPDQLVASLTAEGLGEQLAARLVEDARAHELPFADGDLRAAVARAIARRIPLSPPRRAAGMAVAFVGAAGAGKTCCATSLAAAYARTGTPVLCISLASKDDGAELRRLLAPLGVEVHAAASAAGVLTRLRGVPADTLVVLDTPAVSPTDPTAIERLAEQLAMLGLDETQLVVPAALATDAALELHERLAPLRPTGIALTLGDVDRLGAAVELTCMTRLPLAYVSTEDWIAPADPAELAERLLP